MNPNVTLLADVLEMNVENVAAVVITGLIVVFIGLILLIAFVSFLGKFFTKKPKAKKVKKASYVKEEKVNVPKVATPPVVEEGISDEIVAVIAAAIAAMGAKSGKKLALRSVRTAKPQRNAWASAGIMENTRPFF
ncbi:MAG: sodium pump decarboxylase subunit gamma [Ruminococcus sp.]|nr:sodium pump decarboxylase subunit gamma [Ruminococcus sp.]